MALSLRRALENEKFNLTKMTITLKLCFCIVLLNLLITYLICKLFQLICNTSGTEWSSATGPRHRTASLSLVATPQNVHHHLAATP